MNSQNHACKVFECLSQGMIEMRNMGNQDSNIYGRKFVRALTAKV